MTWRSLRRPGSLRRVSPMRHSQVDALARALESGTPTADGAPDTHARPHDEAQELARLATVLEPSLRRSPARPDPAFRSELRAMLVDEARNRSAALPRILPRVRAWSAAAVERLRWSTRAASAGLAAAVAVSSGGAVAVAANGALPSHPLYGVRVAIDEARATLAFDTVTEGERHLANADERVGDAETAVGSGDGEGAARALEHSTTSMRKGATALIRGYQERGDRLIMQRLTAFTALQRPRVDALADRLDGPAADAARASLVVLDRIERRVVALGGTCGTCPATQPPRDGVAFDFSDIPPADQPFEPCPCDDGSAHSASDGRGTDEEPTDPDEPADEPPDEPGDEPGDEPEPPSPGPVPSLPPPGDVVEDILRDIVEDDAGEPIPAGLPKGGLALPDRTPTPQSSAPSSPAELPAEPQLPAEVPALPLEPGL